jgi:hypothetical protein
LTRKLEKALEQQKNQTEQTTPSISGLLGIPLGGQKRVEVSGRNAYVYVRLRSNQSEVIQAYNNVVSPSYDLPVLVERRSGKYAVVSVDTQRYENNWSSQSPFLPRHGNSHSFDVESGGGGDIVWIYPRQFMPSLVIPSGSVGAGDVFVNAYTIQKSDGTWMFVGNTGTSSIAQYSPSTGAIMALVYLDSVSGNPLLLINSGTVFSSSITGSSQIVPFIPSITNPATQIPLAAVRLVSGTSKILWDNIYDVRQWIHTTPTGTGGVPANTFVPYTGAVSDVNLGNKNLVATGTTTLAGTTISEGSNLQIGSNSPKPTTSAIEFGDGGFVRIFEKYDDSLAIGVYGDDTEIFRVGYNQSYDDLEFLMGDIQGYFHGNYISVSSSGTVIGSSINNNRAFVNPSGTIYVNGLWLVDAVYEDLNFDPDSAGGPAVSLPDYVTINGVIHREFTSGNNQLCGSCKEIPHKAKLSGQTYYPHIHVFLKGGESAGATGVTFTLYWELRQTGGVTSGSTTLSATSAQLSAEPDKLDIHDATGFAGPTELGAQLSLKIERTGGNAGDVVVTTYGVHYPVDAMGSRLVTSK